MEVLSYLFFVVGSEYPQFFKLPTLYLSSEVFAGCNSYFLCYTLYKQHFYKQRQAEIGKN